MEESFLNGRYVLDAKKQLYKVSEDNKILIKQLKKSIYDIKEYNKDYLIDKFGDCYCIQDDKFLFGILGSPLLFNVANDQILCLDVYRRLWICDLNGKILNIIFTNGAGAVLSVKDRILIFESDKLESKGDLAERTAGYHHEMMNNFLKNKSIRKTCVVYENLTETFRFDLDEFVEIGNDEIKYTVDNEPTKYTFNSY